MAKTYRYFGAAGLSGLILALAYPGWRIDLGYLAWFGFIPLIYSLQSFSSDFKTTHKEFLKNAFSIGFTAGIVYFLIVLRFFVYIHPLDTLGVHNNVLSFVITGAVCLISSAGMAVFWGLFSLGYSFWSVKNGKSESGYLFSFLSWLGIPSIFILSEYLRSYGFGLIWSGSNALLGPHWTIGNLAYSLANNNLMLKIASYTGIYGVLTIIILVNCFIYKTLCLKLLKNKKRSVILVCLVFFAVSFGPKFINIDDKNKETAKKLNFSIIQTADTTNLSLDSKETLSNFKKQLEMLTTVAKEHPESQVIIFPETSDFFKNISLFLGPLEVANYFSKLFKEGHLIISGSRVFDTKNGNAYSRVFSLDTQHGVVSYYDKRFIMPGGEFLPYLVKILGYTIFKNGFSAFNHIRDLSPGQKDISTFNFRYQFNVSPMVCSELISPKLVRQTTQNSELIVSEASYGIFHGSSVIARQMLATSRFRAAENKKPLITATNLGRSYAINSFGKTTLLADKTGSQILTGSVVLSDQKSWYNKAGDLPIILLHLVSMASSILLIWFKNQRRS